MLLLLAAPSALVLTAAPVRAVQYLDVEAAQRALFADATRLEPAPVSLSDEQRKAVEKSSGTRTPILVDKIWRAMRGDELLGWFFVDEVYGKHEFITYATGLDASGAVIGIEIMDYRETHGGQVREPSWRQNFHGKRSSDTIELDEDIPNISGATMSCKHITEGVRRVLTLYDVALKER